MQNDIDAIRTWAQNWPCQMLTERGGDGLQTKELDYCNASAAVLARIGDAGFYASGERLAEHPVNRPITALLNFFERSDLTKVDAQVMDIVLSTILDYVEHSDQSAWATQQRGYNCRVIAKLDSELAAACAKYVLVTAQDSADHVVDDSLFAARCSQVFGRAEDSCIVATSRGIQFLVVQTLEDLMRADQGAVGHKVELRYCDATLFQKAVCHPLSVPATENLENLRGLQLDCERLGFEDTSAQACAAYSELCGKVSVEALYAERLALSTIEESQALGDICRSALEERAGGQRLKALQAIMGDLPESLEPELHIELAKLLVEHAESEADYAGVSPATWMRAYSLGGFSRIDSRSYCQHVTKWAGAQADASSEILDVLKTVNWKPLPGSLVLKLYNGQSRDDKSWLLEHSTRAELEGLFPAKAISQVELFLKDVAVYFADGQVTMRASKARRYCESSEADVGKSIDMTSLRIQTFDDYIAYKDDDVVPLGMERKVALAAFIEAREPGVTANSVMELWT